MMEVRKSRQDHSSKKKITNMKPHSIREGTQGNVGFDKRQRDGREVEGLFGKVFSHGGESVYLVPPPEGTEGLGSIDLRLWSKLSDTTTRRSN